jgi:hypothetical protein
MSESNRFPTSRERLPRRLISIESAAVRLDLAPEALRARCRRAARKIGDDIIAHLGGGIIAFKFGRSWRVSFPDP